MDRSTNLTGRRDEGNIVLELRQYAQDGLTDLLDIIGVVAVIRGEAVETLPPASDAETCTSG